MATVLTPDEIKQKIQDWITSLGGKEITGAHLNAILSAIMDYVGVGFAFKDSAPAEAPSSDVPVVYIAGPGTYTGYENDAVEVPEGSMCIFKYDGSDWSKSVLKIQYSITTIKHFVVSMSDYSDWEVGDFAYRTTTKKIRLVTAASGGTATAWEESTPRTNYIYRYGDKLYVWNGTDLVPNILIVDNLTTDDTDKALSAKQGKALKDDIDSLADFAIKQGAKSSLHIIGFFSQSKAIAQGGQVGDYYIHNANSIPILRQITGTATNIETPVTTNGLYSIDSIICRWDGNKFVIADIEGIVHCATIKHSDTYINGKFRYDDVNNVFSYRFLDGDSDWKIREITVNVAENALVECGNVYYRYNGAELVETDNPFLEWLKTTPFEQGNISSTNIQNGNANMIKSCIFLSGDKEYHLPDGFVFVGVVYFDPTSHGFISRSTVNTQKLVLSDTAGKVYKLIVSNSNNEEIKPSDLSAISDEYNASMRDLRQVILTIGHEIIEMTDDIAGFAFNDPLSADDFVTPSRITMQRQIYDHFDALVAAYPDYVSKADVTAELPYLFDPVYANLNGQATEVYAACPSYKTYLYKLIDNNRGVNLNWRNNQPKRKLFIIAGEHANEIAGVVNTYLFAKMMCTGADANFAKLRQVFDIYILPVVNGYGMWNQDSITQGGRVNANGVNINRNYPTFNWAVAGIGTRDYTGPTAASEFETQVVIGLTNKYQFDIAITHHNYWNTSIDNGQGQWYTQVCDASLLNTAMQCLADFSFACVKKYPSYFGSTPKLLISSFVQSPAQSGNEKADPGHSYQWWWQNGVPISLGIEIGNAIGWLNGEPIQNEQDVQDLYGADTFSIGLYQLMVQIITFANYSMNKGKKYNNSNTYTVTYNLTNVTSSNTEKKVTKVCGYLSTLSPVSGDINSVQVIMGGEDKTSLVYDSATHVINIKRVQGDVLIIATAN